ncbi:MAG: Mur ligase family protein, partial [Wenzhouxiangella sp.]
VLAYQAASIVSRRVWVEGYVAGDRVRCLIIGGALVAATRSTPPAIVGNGRHSVAELIAEAARTAPTPRRAHAWKTLLTGDRDVRARLAIAGLEPQSVPESGRTIPLRGEGTAFNGGRLEDVLPRLSTPIRGLAERAAAVCELSEIAAIDLAVVDPAGEASSPNCHVLDVVPDPDLLSHSECRPRARGHLPERLVEALFPPERPARIPTVAVTGTNGKTTTSRMTAAILRRAYRQVGLATTEGAFVNDECLVEGDVAGVTGAALVLADDRVQAAVLETARGGVHNFGTALEDVDAAACLNIASDHVGVDGITSLDELAAIKFRVLELADGHAIINADDPRCLDMRENIARARPILVSRQPQSNAVREHLAAGGRAVLIARPGDGEEWLVLAEGSRSERLLRTSAIPAVMDGLLPFNAQNAAFAAALCWSLGVDAGLIREGLGQFSNSVAGNPGRYNFIEGYPFTLLADFAQNAHGLAELYAVIEKLPNTGRKRLVCLTIGPRHREHIDENAGDLARHFDHLIIGTSDYADSNPQYAGDDPRETMLAHFRRRLFEAGAGEERVETHALPETAIRRGLETAQPGDVLVILGSPKVVLKAIRAESLTGSQDEGVE